MPINKYKIIISQGSDGMVDTNVKNNVKKTLANYTIMKIEHEDKLEIPSL